MAENEKGKKGDYGIGKDDMDNEIITELSPRLYLDKHGITVQETCNCQGGNELGKYEIRLDPTVLRLLDSFDDFMKNLQDKIEIMEEVYESIFSQDDGEGWAFVIAKIPVRLSKKIDNEVFAKCENLEEIKDISTDEIDYISAFESGYVIRLFYSSVEDCFYDFSELFQKLYPSMFRYTGVDYDFKNIDKVIITEGFYRWVPVDSDEEEE